MRTQITIGARIWLVIALFLGAGGSAIGVLTYELKATSASYENTLRDLQDRVRQQDAARVMQVTFKKQVQEWKDVLLRGHDSQDLARYSEGFRLAESQVTDVSASLQASLTDPEAREAAQQFLHAHVQMRDKYEAALQAFTAAGGRNAHEADQ